MLCLCWPCQSMLIYCQCAFTKCVCGMCDTNTNRMRNTCVQVWERRRQRQSMYACCVYLSIIVCYANSRRLCRNTCDMCTLLINNATTYTACCMQPARCRLPHAGPPTAAVTSFVHATCSVQRATNVAAAVAINAMQCGLLRQQVQQQQQQQQLQSEQQQQQRGTIELIPVPTAVCRAWLCVAGWLWVALLQPYLHICLAIAVGVAIGGGCPCSRLQQANLIILLTRPPKMANSLWQRCHVVHRFASMSKRNMC